MAEHDINWEHLWKTELKKKKDPELDIPRCYFKTPQTEVLKCFQSKKDKRKKKKNHEKGYHCTSLF